MKKLILVLFLLFYGCSDNKNYLKIDINGTTHYCDFNSSFHYEKQEYSYHQTILIGKLIFTKPAIGIKDVKVIDEKNVCKGLYN